MTFDNGNNPNLPGRDFDPDRIDEVEALETKSHFDSDLVELQSVIDSIRASETRQPSSEIPADYGYSGNVPDNPLEWTHLLNTGLSRSGFDIEFANEAHASPASKSVRPTGVVRPGSVDVYVHLSQYDQAYDLHMLAFDEGGARHKLLPEMTDGSITYRYLDPTYLGTHGRDLKHIVTSFDRSEESHLTDAFIRLRERWGYVPPSDEEDFQPRVYTAQDMLKTGLIQRAFLTSRLFAALEENKIRAIASTETDKAIYEELRAQGLAPFTAEEMYGLVAGIIRDVQHRYPGLKPVPRDDRLD